MRINGEYSRNSGSAKDRVNGIEPGKPAGQIKFPANSKAPVMRNLIARDILEWEYRGTENKLPPIARRNARPKLIGPQTRAKDMPKDIPSKGVPFYQYPHSRSSAYRIPVEMNSPRLDAEADKRMSGGFKTIASNKCPDCFTFRAKNGNCNCG